jgi:phosphoribosylformimino-5-aminoimidazole carboxamide ribotide isomerase
MNSNAQIKEIDLETVWLIRRDVMYPGRSIEQVKLKDDLAGIHLGVFIDDEPVSVISLFERERVWQFRKFATVKGWQGKGYGTQLVGEVMALAERRAATRIWCNARATACGLYKRFGMEQFGDPWEENGYTYIKMEKRF